MDSIEARNFLRVVNAIKREGYDIEKYNHRVYMVAMIQANTVMCLCTSGNCDNKEINYKILMDNRSASNYWRNCPLSLYPPTNDFHIDFILEQLKFWGSEEGYKTRLRVRGDKYIISYPPYIYNLR